MFSKPSMTTRIAVGKTTAAVLMLISWLAFSDTLSTLSWQFQLGFALWYILLGAVIGAFGMMGPLPVLNLKLPWWLRGPWIGAMFNFILLFFIWDDLAAYQSASFGSETMLASPLLFIVEGALFGLFLDFVATRFGGESED